MTKVIKNRWFDQFKILLIFAAHILTAVAVFCIVGLGAWALHVVRHWMQAAGLDEFVLLAMHGVEVLLFICDVLATAHWAIMSTKRAIVELLEQ